MIRRDRHEVEGLARSPGRARLTQTGEDAGRAGIPPGAGPLCRRRSRLRPCRRDLSPDRGDPVRGSERRDRRGRRFATWRSRSSRSRRSREPTTSGLEILGYPLGPYRSAIDSRQAGQPRGGRAAGLPGVRAVPRRAGAAGTDEAARGPRRPGRARPLAGRRSAGSTTTRRASTPPRPPSTA